MTCFNNAEVKPSLSVINIKSLRRRAQPYFNTLFTFLYFQHSSSISFTGCWQTEKTKRFETGSSGSFGLPRLSGNWPTTRKRNRKLSWTFLLLKPGALILMEHQKSPRLRNQNRTPLTTQLITEQRTQARTQQRTRPRTRPRTRLKTQKASKERRSKWSFQSRRRNSLLLLLLLGYYYHLLKFIDELFYLWF